MSKIEEIMKLLGEAQRQAHEIHEGLLAYRIGQALRVVQQIDTVQRCQKK